MKGLLLMTDNSCNVSLRNSKRQYIFLKKEILLKTIMAVHRFGIRSSVWCRAKIFDLDQAAFRSGCPHCSSRNDLMTFETSIDKINVRIRTVYVSGGLIWVYAYRQQTALCQQAV